MEPDRCWTGPGPSSHQGPPTSIQKALHLLDFVLFNDGDMVTEARSLKADLLEARSKQERSFVAHNILASAALLERRTGRLSESRRVVASVCRERRPPERLGERGQKLAAPGSAPGVPGLSVCRPGHSGEARGE